VLVTLLGLLALAGPPARARIVLLSTSAGAPSPQDANLYDWQGNWISALDRAAPLPGQRPAWEINVALYGDTYTPYGTNVIQEDPTCEIVLQIDTANPVDTFLNPCVEGPYEPNPDGVWPSPTPEIVTPNLAAAGNGPHTVTITAYTQFGQTSTVSFSVDIDNVLPSSTDMIGPVGWQAGGEVIGSAAGTSGPSGIAGQSCSIGSGAPSWYPGASAQLAVTGDGRIPVRCAAVNAAGVPGATTEYDALLDNTPPSGYFAPRDPDNPALARVVVADRLSGVAGGQIQIETSGGWQPLAGGYSPATGLLSAAIPDDGSVPDGNYALRAIVWDAVGNVATITSDRSSTPEIITVPLRIVTQLPVGRSLALIKRCSVSRAASRDGRSARHRRVADRLVRRCSLVPLPRRGGVIRLRFDQQATVTGVMETADGEAVAGARVQVSQHAPGWATRPAGTVTTDKHGRFTYTIQAGPSRTITFSFLGTPTMRASVGTTTVQAFGKARIEVSPSARAGSRVRIAGRVLGGYIPSGGVLVQLQYQISGLSVGWAPFHAPVRTDGRGRFSVTFPVPAAAAGYTYLFRALVAGQNGWPFLTTHSNATARPIL
jgi:hypothetical protein